MSTMATHNHHADDTMANLERQLDEKLANASTPLADLLNTLAKLRSISEQSIEHDVQTITQLKSDDRLWNAHLKVNGRFRTPLRRLRKEGNTRIVEFRKLSKDYERFIKSSQASYRNQIQKLALTHGTIPALERVVGTMTPHKNRKDTKDVTPQLQKQVLIYCHQNLIHLGDLSRYRETELSKTPDWRPAIGYYDLADTIYPASGTSHNQLAVMAQHDGDRFRATYHLYRAMTVKEPFPSARQNLDIEFRKVLNAHRSRSINDKNGVDSLRSNFILLHAVYFGKDDTVDQDALETEVIDLMVSKIEEVPVTLLIKIVLINIAAEFIAQEHAHTELQVWLHLLRLNVRTFNLLLRKLEVELLTRTSALNVLLPAVRLYSAWMLCNSKLVAGAIVNPLLQSHITELWTAYASCLSFLARQFPADSLPSLNYMLKEDTDTIGFKPLYCDATAFIWSDDTKDKPKWSEMKESDRDASAEMLFRIRCILLIGLQLAYEEDAVPLALENATFVYHANTMTSPKAGSQKAASLTDTSGEPWTNNETAAQDMEASRMVDELVGSHHIDLFDTSLSVETLPDGNDPPTPPDQYQPDRSDIVNTSSFPVGSETAHDLVNAAIGASKSQPQSPSGGSRKLNFDGKALTVTVLQNPTRHSVPTSPIPPAHSRKLSGASTTVPWTSFQQPNPATPALRKASPLANENLPTSPFSTPLPVDGSVDLTYDISLFGIGNTKWTPSGSERKRLSADQTRSPSFATNSTWRNTPRPDP